MDYETSAKMRNPWERVLEDDEDFYTPEAMYYNKNLARKRPKFTQREENRFLDIQTKRATLVASPFVVSLVSYTGEKEMSQGSGFIISTDYTNTGIIFTSANLIRKPTVRNVAENELADDLKVEVKLANGRAYNCVICACDFHYNIAALSFTSDVALSCAPMKRVDDSLDINPRQFIGRHLGTISLVPGDAVVGLGRYFVHPYEVMAASGVFCLDDCNYECKELFYADCSITRSGDGGPVINLAGDVIGLAFCDHFFTPFLPINIAYKWWELRKKDGEFCPPSVGIEATNFYAADLTVLEKIIQTFPSISKGVLVEKVIPGSVAESAGLHMNDVIIQCGGKVVSSFLEFMEIILDNVGHIVELDVARVGFVTLFHPKIMVAKLASDKLNSWRPLEERG